MKQNDFVVVVVVLSMLRVSVDCCVCVHWTLYVPSTCSRSLAYGTFHKNVCLWLERRGIFTHITIYYYSTAHSNSLTSVYTELGWTLRYRNIYIHNMSDINEISKKYGKTREQARALARAPPYLEIMKSKV